MNVLKTASLVAAGFAFAGPASAVLISEFEPNPPGGDPADSTFELAGTAGEMFDLFLLSLENDGFSGTVDRASSVTGTFDSNGLAVVTVPDLENPSFTVILTDRFTGAIGDDLDTLDNGALNLSSLGTILDAIGVSDETADDSSLYASLIGGTDILFNGEFEPLSVFRSGSTGELFNTVTIDFGDPEERIGIFDALGNEVSADLFPGVDATATTFGAVNPTVVPEPASLALVALGGVALMGRRRTA